MSGVLGAAAARLLCRPALALAAGALLALVLVAGWLVAPRTALLQSTQRHVEGWQGEQR